MVCKNGLPSPPDYYSFDLGEGDLWRALLYKKRESAVVRMTLSTPKGCRPTLHLGDRTSPAEERGEEYRDAGRDAIQ